MVKRVVSHVIAAIAGAIALLAIGQGRGVASEENPASPIESLMIDRIYFDAKASLIDPYALVVHQYPPDSTAIEETMAAWYVPNRLKNVSIYAILDAVGPLPVVGAKDIEHAALPLLFVYDKAGRAKSVIMRGGSELKFCR